MKFVLELSLEQIVLVKLTATLWNQDDIRTLMKKFSLPLHGSEKSREWLNMEDKVAEKVLQLEQPELLREKILGLIKPIGLQILKWVKYHRDLFFDITDLPSEFSWTPQGTIDRKKTAEILIQDDNLDITNYYKFVCNYCLKDHFVQLWNKISEDNRKAIENDDYLRDILQLDLALFVTYDAKQEVAKLENLVEKILGYSTTDSPYMYALEYAANSGNKTAVEYFLKKLVPDKRRESIIWAADLIKKRISDSSFKRTEIPKDYFIEILLFLLSNMDEEQQLKLIRGHAYEVLKSFLDWPFQSFFLETVNCVWNFINTIDFNCMLEVIMDKIMHGYKDWNYQKLFREFWKQSLDTHKKFSVCRCTSNSTLLLDLFKIRDKENIGLILKYATTKEKEEIIFNYNGKNICENLVYSQNFETLISFLQECILSKDVMNKFKIEFKEHIKSRHPEKKLKKEKDMWKKVFQLLDDLVI